eukprot:1539984-Lingulodinium_polyedra.AAC.1
MGGGDPRQRLLLWSRAKGVGSNDRVLHEMKVLTDVLYYGGRRGPTQLPILASMECVVRRLQL